MTNKLKLEPKLSLDLVNTIQGVQLNGKLVAEFTSIISPYSVKIYELTGNRVTLLVCKETANFCMDLESATYIKPGVVAEFCRQVGSPEFAIILDPDNNKLSAHTANLPMFIYADSHSNLSIDVGLSIKTVGKQVAYSNLSHLWSYLCGFIAGRTHLDLSNGNIAQYVWFLDEYSEINIPKDHDDQEAGDETYAIKA